MFDNLSGLFATQTKDTNSERVTSYTKEDNEASSAKEKIKMDREARETSSKSETVLSQTRKAVQSASSSLTDNNTSQKNTKEYREMLNTLDDINAKLESRELNAKFTVDRDSNTFVVQLVDGNGKVIRQIPSESSLEFTRNAEKGVGLFVDKDL